MIGGTGNDTYIVNNSADVVLENNGEGNDTVQASVTYTLSANVENLTLTGSGNINGTGNTLDNVITGNGGINTLTGGAGNDTYIVDSLADTVTEAANEGTDEVQTSLASYSLAANANVENLTGTAATGQTLTGNGGANTITGGIGNDTLDGGAGNDTMIGGAGNDTYVVDSALDVVTEALNEGTDTVQATVTFTLSANVENLTLTGSGNIDGTGNALGNVITGNGGSNTLTGGGGDDTAVFSGALADYAIVRNTGPAGTGFTVTDLRGGSPDGTDTVTGVEQLQFSDATVATAQFPANIDLSPLDGSNGFKLSGAAANDQSGRSVASAGDVNGDGFADLIVGALGPTRTAASPARATWCSARPRALPPISTCPPRRHHRLQAQRRGGGRRERHLGRLGRRRQRRRLRRRDRRRVYARHYVVFGKASGFAANIDLSSLDGSTGFRLAGAGQAVASAGDVNGDGFADLIVGCRGAASYVVFGKASGFAANINLSSLDGINGFKLSGRGGKRWQRPLGRLGRRRQRRRLRRPDRRRYRADPNGTDSGASYVVFGKASGFAANLDLSSLDGSTGFKLSGAAAVRPHGFSVASAGDVNGDGFADLIVGAH